jgi:hypothetical protein
MTDYIWPLSGTSTEPDEMNTSFGPRINLNRWDFHDGIDLPAQQGTNIHAVRDGKVHHAGPGGSGGYSSRHVVVEVATPTGEPVYTVYLHLDSIDAAVLTDAGIEQGQVIGTVGRDDATYDHLHLEFRKGTYKQIDSVHPLSYLPYNGSRNFSVPVADRFNRLDAFMAARILFGANRKQEGDLKRVEVDLRRGDRLLTTRVVDLDDKRTVSEERGDLFRFVNDIGVEGYQESNMANRDDLAYGILVRAVPRACESLVARVIDLGGHVVTSASIAVPQSHTAVDDFVDFEDSQFPSGWTTVTGSDPTTSISITESAAHTGTQGMRCVNKSRARRCARRVYREILGGRPFRVAGGGLVQSGRAGHRPRPIGGSAHASQRRRPQRGSPDRQPWRNASSRPGGQRGRR